MASERSRRLRLVGLIGVAFVGLVAIVLLEGIEPAWVRASGGDVLIVVPIYALVAIARPRRRSPSVAAITFAYAAAIEFSQLYHAPAIDRFRATFVGRMTIGSTFVPSDFLCYAIGTLVALAFDTWITRRFDRLAGRLKRWDTSSAPSDVETPAERPTR